MTLNAIDNLTSAAPLRPPLGETSDRFERLMTEAQASDKPRDEAREAAEKFIATALVMPLLDELREQPLDAGLFHGGMAEDAFRQRMDTILADRIVSSSQFPIVDRIYSDITRQSSSQTQTGVDLIG